LRGDNLPAPLPGPLPHKRGEGIKKQRAGRGNNPSPWPLPCKRGEGIKNVGAEERDNVMN